MSIPAQPDHDDDMVICKALDDAAAEIIRLRQELRYITDAKPSTWDDPSDFRPWAQNRARHALDSQNAQAVPNGERDAPQK